MAPPPTRRLIVALTILLVGVFGIGAVTAVRRGADKPRTDAGNTPSPSITDTTAPSVQPSETPTPEPSVSPTAVPSPGTGDGTGTPPAPSMPNTGLPGGVLLAGALAAAAAAAIRRSGTQTHA